jgi:hypothetical protein
MMKFVIHQKSWYEHWSDLGIAVVLGIIYLIAITGIVDDNASMYLSNEIRNAALIAGISRGINASISVIQSTDVNLVIASISPGEMLDPINDLIERFSNIILISIASLAIQEIILFIVKHDVFNLALLVVMILYMASRLLFKKAQRVMLLILIAVVAIRLLMPFVVLINGSIDRVFLMDKSSMHNKNIALFDRSAASVSRQLSRQDNPEIQTVDLELRRKELQNRIHAMKAEIDASKKKKSDLSNELGNLPSGTVICQYNPFCAKSMKARDLQEKISGIDVQMDEREVALDELVELHDEVTWTIACKNKINNGGSCSFGEWFTSKVDNLNISERIQQLNRAAEKLFEDVFAIIALLLIKTILLPFIIAVGFIKFIEFSWRSYIMID